MEKQYFTIKEISQFLSLRPSNLYSKVESGAIPHYRVGRLVLFRKSEVEEWMQKNRREITQPAKKARDIIKTLQSERPVDIERLRKKAIEEVTKKEYTSSREKPGRIKGLGKEVEDGLV